MKKNDGPSPLKDDTEKYKTIYYSNGSKKSKDVKPENKPE